MTNIVVPELGESVVEARVLLWMRQVGDAVAVGDPLVELETEKVNLEVAAEKAGTLAFIAHQEGDDVTIGEVLGVIEDGVPAAAAASAAAPRSAPPVPPSPVAAGPAAAARPPAPVLVAPTPPAPTGPPVPPMARPAPAVPSSTPRSVAPAAAPSSLKTRTEYTDDGRVEERTRMSKRRATIARRLVEAQRTAAMLTTFNEIDMSAVMALRERHKELFKKHHGVNLGIASFFVKAAVAALRAFPHLNAEIQGDEIVVKRYYDIGMAVGAEGGLVVPVIRNADTLSFAGIETAIRSFAARAADGTLTLDDLTGGSFTITNGGVFGSMLSTPILNPPQVGILGLHKIQDRCLPINGKVEIRPMMYAALSYDHRLVDGREAVQFLVAIKTFIEDPGHMLIEG